MDKGFLEYYSGNVNVYQCGSLTIGREKTSNNNEYIIIEVDGKELYKFWNTPKKKKETSNKPKHTGGKPSYVMAMHSEILKYKLSNNAKAFLFSMMPYMQWETNLLVDIRSKEPLNTSDICKITGNSNKTILATIAELKQNGLITKDKDGYKISPTLMRKGGKKK